MSGNNIKAKEQAIGKRAAKMAQDYVLATIRQRLDTRDKAKNSLLKATKVTSKMGDYVLQGLDFKTNKTGYVQHYGFTGVRYAGAVYLKASRYNKKYTSRDPHNFNLPAKDLFKDIYSKSGALDYLLKELEQTRTDAVIAKISNMVLKLNSEDNG